MTFSKSWPFALRASCARRQACGFGPPSSMWQTYSVSFSVICAPPASSSDAPQRNPRAGAAPALASLARWPTHAAFLRGMNLGRRRLTNERAARRTSRRSGFDGRRDASAPAATSCSAAPQPRAESTLRRADRRRASASLLGYQVATFVRTAEELRAIAAAEPVRRGDARAACSGKLQVDAARRAPPAAARARGARAGRRGRLARVRRARAATGCRRAASATPRST